MVEQRKPNRCMKSLVHREGSATNKVQQASYLLPVVPFYAQAVELQILFKLG